MGDTELLVKTASQVVNRTCTRPVTVRGKDGFYGAVRCGSRLREVCPGCASIVHGDYQRIFRSGVFDAAPSDRFLFVTLTAPSFGPTHHVPKRPEDKRRCRCGVVHDIDRDADLRGLPLNSATYDYVGQVDFNATAGSLWNATRTALGYHFPGMEYAGVYEDQARGAVHLHMLIRLPAAQYDPLLSKARILQCARQASAWSLDTGQAWAWGMQIDVRAATPGDDLGRSIWYLLKAVNYLTKEVSDGGTTTSPRQGEHWRQLGRAAQAHRCDACRGQAKPCDRLLHRRNGRRSHTVVLSRGYRGEGGWSVTGLRRGTLRAERAAWTVEYNTDTDARVSAEESFARACNHRALRKLIDRYRVTGTADPVS